jgi:hypothetical protein
MLDMNPVPLVGVVLGQPDSHLCQLPLVLILLHQFNTTDSVFRIRDLGCSRIRRFFPSRIPDPSTTKKKAGKNKLILSPFLVAIFNFLKQV